MARTQTHKTSNHNPPTPPQQTHSQQTPPQQKQPQQAPATTTRSAASTQRSGPTQEQIARRAYEIFLARGGSHGRHEDDWIQAERELKLGR